MKLQDLADRRFSYDAVGSTTRPELTPPGYHRVEHRARIGNGDEVFLKAGEVLMSWQMHRAAGLWIEADSPRAEIGTNSLGRLGFGGIGCRCHAGWSGRWTSRTGSASDTELCKGIPSPARSPSLFPGRTMTAGSGLSP
jgi:hypothetical protein